MPSVNYTANHPGSGHTSRDTAPAAPALDAGRRSFPFQLVAGHVVLDVGGRPVLLDTGSPLSFGIPAALEPFGAGRELATTLAGVAVGDVAAEIGSLAGGPGPGLRLDALLGCDLLAGCAAEIDWAGGAFRVAFPAGARPPTGLLTCIPQLTLDVAGRRVNAIADTGAWLTYVAPDLVRGAPAAGRRRDFMPVLGSFDVDLVRCEVALGTSSFEATVAIAPPPVLLALALCDGSAVVGTDLLAHAGVTLLAFHGASSEARCLSR